LIERPRAQTSPAALTSAEDYALLATVFLTGSQASSRWLAGGTQKALQRSHRAIYPHSLWRRSRSPTPS
jgi:hypothetical protein